MEAHAYSREVDETVGIMLSVGDGDARIPDFNDPSFQIGTDTRSVYSSISACTADASHAHRFYTYT
jgi:hypothetical protein